MRKQIFVLIISILYMGSVNVSAQDYVNELLRSEDLSDYGGNIAIGPSILGAGIVGFNVKGMLGQKVGLEGAAAYHPSIISFQGRGRSSSLKWYHGVMFTFGPTIFFKKDFNRSGTKVIANGIFIRGGYSVGTIQESVAIIGWARERFRFTRYNSSFGLQLGAGFTHFESASIPLQSYGNFNSDFNLLISIKLKWNFYVG